MTCDWGDGRWSWPEIRRITSNIGLERANSSIYRCKRDMCNLYASVTSELMMKLQLASILALVSASALGAPTSYTIDPDHTHPSFEVDHFGGLSTWRGTFKKTTGSVELDAAGKTGTVDVIVDTATIDFAHDKLNEHVSSPEMLDVSKFP